MSAPFVRFAERLAAMGELTMGAQAITVHMTGEAFLSVQTEGGPPAPGTPQAGRIVFIGMVPFILGGTET